MPEETNEQEHTIHVLLVEDNEDHIFLTRRALQSSGLPLTIHVVNDGDEALEFVFQTGAHATAPRPDLILLDVKLPGKDGFEVLQELKSNDAYRSIPIIMLTSSTAEADIIKGYGLGSNSYVSKPVTFDEMVTKLGKLPSYWVRTNILPPHRPKPP
jgi:CheY-like chemotaxis protein